MVHMENDHEPERYVALWLSPEGWRALGTYAERSEAYRSSAATRADGHPVRIYPITDPRITRLLRQRNYNEE